MVTLEEPLVLETSPIRDRLEGIGLDFNVVLNGLYFILAMALVTILALVYMQHSEHRDSFRQVIGMTAGGIQREWDTVGDDVRQTDTPIDDIMYTIGNIPMQVFVGKLREMGYELKPIGAGDEEVVLRTATEDDTGGSGGQPDGS